MSSNGERELITVRGHTLLCLQGFRGEGYSKTFIENMHRIHRRLEREPETLVRAVVQPDEICDACPNLGPSGCQLRGEGFEGNMRAQDREVLTRLSITEGEVLSWREILRRIGSALPSRDLTQICGSCPWLPLGYCREGIDRLRDAGGEP